MSISTASAGAAQIFSGLSDDETNILTQSDRFARAELYPLAKRMDDEEWWPTEVFPLMGRKRVFRYHCAT
jgi:isovaleryl-CoA dehydrogenase